MNMIDRGIEKFDRFVAKVEVNKEILGDEFYTEVSRVADNFLEEMSCIDPNQAAEQCMEELSTYVVRDIIYNKRNLSEESLKAIISVIPSVLSTGDRYGRIPIQLAVLDCYYGNGSLDHICFLAKEGMKYGVGGEGKRGGLLVEFPQERDPENSLQLIAAATTTTEASPKYDKICLDKLKKLKKVGLLTVQDVTDHELLLWTIKRGRKAQRRFEYLCDLDPEAMKKSYPPQGETLFHQIIRNHQRRSNARLMIEIFFRCALKHFPQDLGLLFQRDKEGRTAFQTAISTFGFDRTFGVIRACIPQETTLPILHHVVKHAPRYVKDFAYCYPNDVYFEDDEGGGHHSVCQARLARTDVTLRKDLVLFIIINPDQAAISDPVTGLYPFMLAASDEDTYDLDAVYYLFRRAANRVYE